MRRTALLTCGLVILLVPGSTQARPRCVHAPEKCQPEPQVVMASVEHVAPTETRPVDEATSETRRLVGLAARLADTRDVETLEQPDKAQKRRARKRTIPIGVVRLVFPWEDPVDIRIYDENGALQATALQYFASYAGIPGMDDVEPRLLAILYALTREYDRPIHVVSAYRDGEQFGGLDAGHDEGRAVDIYIEGIAAADLRDFCAANFDAIGLGYRPHTGLVHIDVREQSTHWVDTAQAGRTAREKLVEVPTLEHPEPTLGGWHIQPAELYPEHRPPRDSRKASD